MYRSIPRLGLRWRVGPIPRRTSNPGLGFHADATGPFDFAGRLGRRNIRSVPESSRRHLDVFRWSPHRLRYRHQCERSICINSNYWPMAVPRTRGSDRALRRRVCAGRQLSRGLSDDNRCGPYTQQYFRGRYDHLNQCSAGVWRLSIYADADRGTRLSKSRYFHRLWSVRTQPSR
jgi:hypothetical protein